MLNIFVKWTYNEKEHTGMIVDMHRGELGRTIAVIVDTKGEFWTRHIGDLTCKRVSSMPVEDVFGG